jgi:hypothetical protein
VVSTALSNLGMIHERRGPAARAGEHYQRTIAANPDNGLRALTANWKVVRLRVWETAEQAIVCPLARDDWDAITCPFTEGADGPGKIDLLAEPTARAPAGGLN